ncbi:Gfo/Idh/MocA family protein [Orenia marismortui]|uniref:Virulence factor n=1 Tax=Orenia marismortui TaxID=46469 RepID=A0A4R8GZT7_9FIRM|nr:Gfo/Idh/MocA family oxidoreductase [Orenia marismortui]TDX52370.1 virulence factor [Orenia marismortui]
MKIGVIGLGDIAQKAYLPIIGVKRGIELVFCTRDEEKLNYLADKYKVNSKVRSIDELIETNIKAAFVHAATIAHVSIVEKLLNNNIDVYVDKPISYSIDESRRIVNLAKEKGLKLMIGFNRRYAPMYQKLKEIDSPAMIMLEKNRLSKPQEVREAIYDDFIHIIDTMRFLAGDEAENIAQNITVDGIVKDNLLYQVTVKLRGENLTVIGIMNRDSGVNEENAQVIASNNKVVVKDLVEMSTYKDGEVKVSRVNDWSPMLANRGFTNIVDSFLSLIKEDKFTISSISDALKTHELCELIISKLLKN